MASSGLEYVGRFVGSDAAKKDQPLIVEASSGYENAQKSTGVPLKDVFGGKTAGKWSVLNERLGGLINELAQVSGGMDPYCSEVSTMEGPAMAAIRHKMETWDWKSEWDAGKTMFAYGEEMSTDPLEGQLLKALVAMRQPRNILEVGTFVGYGAVAMLEGCASTRVTTLEIDPYLKTWIMDCMKAYPDIANRMEIFVGAALDTIPQLPAGEEFDMVFVDANKSEYVAYVELLMKLDMLSDDVVIVADNTLYCGMPYTDPQFDTQPKRRGFGESIKAFNKYIANHSEFCQVILPVRDGVSLIHRKPDAQTAEATGNKEITYYQMKKVSHRRITTLCEAAFSSLSKVAVSGNWREDLASIIMVPEMQALLTHITRLPVFTVDMAKAFMQDLPTLQALKALKYWYVLPQSTFLVKLRDLSKKYGGTDMLSKVTDTALDGGDASRQFTRELCTEKNMTVYLKNAEELEIIDPHAVFPTSNFRACDGHVLASATGTDLEAVMSTTLTTSIKILTDTLDPANKVLSEIYKPLGRCVAIVDSHVDHLYGTKFDAYFAHHNVPLRKLCFRGMEADKGMATVETILHALKSEGVSRNEPILIVGGGVIADVAGFASALYHRNSPYVMLCTSIVSGIDAGPSPRTCCDGFGYKNIYGAYHPPVLTLTDRTFFKTLKTGWLRHGIAEIIKMAVVKDMTLFEALETAGGRLIHTHFGTLEPEDIAFGKLCDSIIAKAMEGYVRSEYGNLWETHQARPHAYGHTWSPGYEIPAGMLHGHAVATGMGFGAFMAWKEGFITEQMCVRIMTLISTMELSLWHPIMDDHEVVWASQVKMVQKRGGHLCAPVPKGDIGKCGYINKVSKERLVSSLNAYKAYCQPFPNRGVGLEPHCHDVGLEDPSVVGTHEKNSAAAGALEEIKALKDQLAAANERIASLEK